MNQTLPRTPFSTALSGSAKETERRIRNIFSGPKKRPPLPLLVLVFAACLLCGNLVSCNVAGAEADDPGDTSQTDTSLTDTSLTDTSQVEPDAARAAYTDVLTNILENLTLPDGYTFPAPNPEYESISDNRFALADVDGDGREELVVLFTTAATVGHAGYVLDYDQDTGSVRIQFEGYPSFTFYENGALAEDDSHAQGVWTDDFWPHSLYRYLPETDRYELAGHLSAWEKAVSDRNPDVLPPFPTEKDVSGAGILYYITPAEDMGPSFAGYSTEAVDQSVYLEWLEPILEGSQPLELEYLPLTAENIETLK